MMRAVLICLAIVSISGVCLPADFEQTVVFRSGHDGYHTYRIPSLIATSSGTLLAFCEGRRNGSGDSGDIDLLVKRSSDGGVTWAMQQVIWDDGPNTCGNPCPVIDKRTGRIVLLTTWNRGDDHGNAMKRGTATDTRRPFVLSSDDDGRSWSRPREITDSAKAPDWWWYATGPGIGIQIRRGPHAGRLVIPANHTSAQHGFGALTIFSDDSGKIWRHSNVIKPACSESQLVELADGTLMINSRSQSFTDTERTGFRSIAFSHDAGETWSEPEFDKHIGDPVCQASFIRYSLEGAEGRNRLLFSNPNPPISPQRGPRIKMTVRLSYDEGKTWPVSKLLHAGPSAYSCLAVLPDKTIACLYECGDTFRYEKIAFAKFSLEWLTDGKDSVRIDNNSMRKVRKEAAHRTRRIIMNNDGNDRPTTPVTPQSFLESRTAALAGTHVDSIFYCDGVFNLYTHPSAESEQMLYHKRKSKEWVVEFNKRGYDALQIITDFCHENGLEAFWSMRMNDTHDAHRPDLFCKWKEEHRDLLMSPEMRDFLYERINGSWSAVNYEYPEVRDKVFAILQDVCNRYDVDGVELDFLRFPVFFKPQLTGEPVTQEHCNMMTDLLKRIRTMTERIARNRRRPLLIAVHVPDSVGYSKSVGLDLIRWLEEDLIDIIVAANNFHLQPWKKTVEIAKPYNVPVYACFNPQLLPKDDIRIWRGEALRAWEAGVSGIYTFNVFDPHDKIFQELGDPVLLNKLPKVDTYKLTKETIDHVNSIGGFLKYGERFFDKTLMLRWEQPYPEDLRIGIDRE